MLVATVGLRPDLTSVKAMQKDPAWLTPGGWRDKAIVELDLVLNQKKALVPRTHQEYLAYVRRFGDRVQRLNILWLRQDIGRRYPRVATRCEPWSQT